MGLGDSDYCKVNAAVTHQDAYPLLCIDVTLDSLAGSAYFSTLDLASGYWQVELDNEAKEKTHSRLPVDTSSSMSCPLD